MNPDREQHGGLGTRSSRATSVPIQLKNFTAIGTAMSIVISAK